MAVKQNGNNSVVKRKKERKKRRGGKKRSVRQAKSALMESVWYLSTHFSITNK